MAWTDRNWCRHCQKWQTMTSWAYRHIWKAGVHGQRKSAIRIPESTESIIWMCVITQIQMSWLIWRRERRSMIRQWSRSMPMMWLLSSLPPLKANGRSWKSQICRGKMSGKFLKIWLLFMKMNGMAITFHIWKSRERKSRYLRPVVRD